MKATSIPADSTRIIPARPERKAKTVTRQPNGDFAVEWADGSTGTIGADEPDLQAFLLFTMINPET